MRSSNSSYLCICVLSIGIVTANFLFAQQHVMEFKIADQGKKSEPEDYGLWKEMMRGEWDRAGLSNKIERMSDLLWILEEDLELLNEVPQYQELQTEVLYEYNFLREILEKSQAISLGDIDYGWVLENAQADIMKQDIIESYGAQEPSRAKARLVKDVQETLELEDTVVALSCPEQKAGAFAIARHEIAFICMCYVPDVDQALFAVYHEFGHVVHKDIYVGEGCPQRMLNSVEHQADIRKIDCYINLGKKAFDRSTKLGRRINDILAKYPHGLLFWKPPQEEYEKSLCIRSSELRADLFAAQKLLQQRTLSPLILSINDYSYDYPIAWQDYVKSLYPNHFERAIYLAGFLVDNGIDINAEIKEWEHTGTCIALETRDPFAEFVERNKKELSQCRAIEPDM